MNATLDADRHALSPDLVSSLQTRFSRQLRVQVADWQDTCRALSAWEDANLVEGRLPAALSEHAAMLDRLEKFGGWLLHALEAAGSDAGDLAEEVGLTMQDLSDTRSLWHGSVDAGRKAAILNECFGDRAS